MALHEKTVSGEISGRAITDDALIRLAYRDEPANNQSSRRERPVTAESDAAAAAGPARRRVPSAHPERLTFAADRSLRVPLAIVLTFVIFSVLRSDSFFTELTIKGSCATASL